MHARVGELVLKRLRKFGAIGQDRPPPGSAHRCVRPAQPDAAWNETTGRFPQGRPMKVIHERGGVLNVRGFCRLGAGSLIASWLWLCSSHPSGRAVRARVSCGARGLNQDERPSLDGEARHRNELARACASRGSRPGGVIKCGGGPGHAAAETSMLLEIRTVRGCSRKDWLRSSSPGSWPCRRARSRLPTNRRRRRRRPAWRQAPQQSPAGSQ